MFMTKKPVGKFTIPDTAGADDRRLKVLVAAGTGLAPFISMVRSEVLRDPAADLSKYVLLHGASYPADLCYRAEILRYVAENKLRYLSTISRPKEAPDWKGDVGRGCPYAERNSGRAVSSTRTTTFGGGPAGVATPTGAVGVSEAAGAASEQAAQARTTDDAHAATRGGAARIPRAARDNDRRLIAPEYSSTARAAVAHE